MTIFVLENMHIYSTFIVLCLKVIKIQLVIYPLFYPKGLSLWRDHFTLIQLFGSYLALSTLSSVVINRNMSG